jgi:hypothetical protein
VVVAQQAAQQTASWFPLAVSAIGSLGFGAFVGALVAHYLREQADRKRSDQEKLALLRLINFEMAGNRRWFKVTGVDKLVTYLQRGGSLTTDAWESTRVRLAQLLPEDDFDRLAIYYFIQQHYWSDLEFVVTQPQGEERIKRHLDRYAETYDPNFDAWMTEISLKYGLGRSKPMAELLDEAKAETS